MYSNQKRELNDIRFEFAVGVDSAEGIAAELVGAGLVDGKDIVVIAANLQKLIDSAGALRTVTFSLVRIIRSFHVFSSLLIHCFIKGTFQCNRIKNKVFFGFFKKEYCNTYHSSFLHIY